MVENNDNHKLIHAINSNNWNETYLLAKSLNLITLRKSSNWFQDKINEECIQLMYEDDDPKEDKVNQFKLKNWFNSHKDKINNKYMYSLIESFTLESTREEINIQTATFEDLTKKFPNRWETYLSLAFTWVDQKSRSKKYLIEAQKLSPKSEAVFFWDIVLNQHNRKRQLEICEQAYKVNNNIIFIYFKALTLEHLGNVKTSKFFFQKIIDQEPKGSYLHKKAKGEIKSGCFIATVVYNDKYAPEVETLRLIRNYYSKYAFGRYFIKMYYFISPLFAKFIRNNQTFLKYTKLMLDQICQNIHQR